MNKKFLKEYFSFSRREQNGILVLALIIILLILINLVISWLPGKNSIVDKEKMQEAIQDFDLINQKSKERYAVLDSNRDSADVDIPFELFDFDPNHITKPELLKLGIPEKTATTFINYLEKGGRFYKKKDVLKIYGIDTSTYKKLEPFINIEGDVQIYGQDEKLSSGRSINKIVELNKADTVDLLPLQGIGPVLAKRILKYRNILGGFISKDQLLEVYGISKIVFQEISPVIEVDSTQVIKLDLNQSTYADLIRHPYFDQELVLSILELRKEREKFRSVLEIRESKILTEERYRKILPYICVKM